VLAADAAAAEAARPQRGALAGPAVHYVACAAEDPSPGAFS
jgi:hypothetical protein